MRQPEVDQVSGLELDYVGFIFYPASPRFVGENISFTPKGETQTVGVFVNEERSKVVKALGRIGSRIAQLHGNEMPDQCEALRDLGYTVIKANSVDDAFDPQSLVKYQNAVDYFLFDTKGKLHGGNAKKFNWHVLTRYDQHVPFFLSGGIGIDDLEDIRALRNMNLHAVDMNSGLELSPGVKDIERVKKAKELVAKL